MLQFLTITLNFVLRKDLESLYGKDSYVHINSIRFCTNKRIYTIDCKLYVTDVDLFKESQMDGINYLIEEAWNLTGKIDEKIGIICGVDYQ